MLENSASENRRFARLLSSGNRGRPPWDQVLYEIRDCVVAPTLGSILPNWLLVVPRSPAVNFADWRLRSGCEPFQLVRDVLAFRNVELERVIWFEHGPAMSGSVVGCGVDHAHIHLVIDPPFSSETFRAAVVRESGLSWQECASDNAYRGITPTVSYLVASWRSQAIVATRVESVGSQFFRRVIAELAGEAAKWDYRTFPFHQNAQQTVENFAQQFQL